MNKLKAEGSKLKGRNISGEPTTFVAAVLNNMDNIHDLYDEWERSEYDGGMMIEFFKDDRKVAECPAEEVLTLGVRPLTRFFQMQAMLGRRCVGRVPEAAHAHV